MATAEMVYLSVLNLVKEEAPQVCRGGFSRRCFACGQRAGVGSAPWGGQVVAFFQTNWQFVRSNAASNTSTYWQQVCLTAPYNQRSGLLC